MCTQVFDYNQPLIDIKKQQETHHFYGGHKMQIKNQRGNRNVASC